jgi:hypothetical protein
MQVKQENIYFMLEENLNMNNQMEYKLWNNQVTTDWETYLDWLQIQAEYSFTFWLNERVSMEFYKMNFWYYFNTCGITFVNSNIPIGIPIIYGTSGDEESAEYRDKLLKMWENAGFEIIDYNPETQWNERYIIGVDPYYVDDSGNSKCEIFKQYPLTPDQAFKKEDI